MTIHFVRHGESLANEQNLFAGRQNTPLTDLGRRQARQAGDRVAALGAHYDEVHVSPLDRARHTAEIIVDQLGVRPEFVESTELVERDFGVFTAQNKSLVKKSIGFQAYTEYFHSSTGCPPGGESWTRMYERVRDYYQEVLLPQSRDGRTLLVVAHKYVVEMFAVVVAEIPPEAYHDLKIPNARPLSEADLSRICRGAARSSAVHDFGEIVEIRLPAIVTGAAVVGLLAQLALRVTVPPWLFSLLLIALLGVSTFFGMIRLHSGALHGFWSSLRIALPLTIVRAAMGLFLLSDNPSTPTLLLGLLLLLPPALITPTLSLLWGGDYFTSLRQTVAASLVLPVLVLAALWWAPHRFAGLGSAVAGYLGVLLGAMALPAVLAQVLRRRDPIRAGQLSTNWNWLGGAALVPLAGFSTFALTPATGMNAVGFLAGIAVVTAALVALRLAATMYLRLRTFASGVARDVFITQCTPNVFLWFALLGTVGDGTAPLAPIAAFGFFAAMLGDELVIVRRYARGLRAATSSALRTSHGDRVLIPRVA